MFLKKVIQSLLALIIGLLAAYTLVCLYAATLGDYFIFATQAPTYTLTKDSLTTTSPGGLTIPLTYLSTSNARWTILYSHGNLEDLGFVHPRLEVFAKHGFNVLGYDYPGFGACPGKKSEAGCFDAAEAAYNYLTQTLKVDPSRIILYGRSMGGGPNAWLASRHVVGGVVMHSTFVTAFRVQTGIHLLPWDRFENIKRIPLIKSPILFVHGVSDETIPVWHTKMMMALTQAPMMSLLVPYALHNNVMEMAREDYWQKLEEFTGLMEKVLAEKEALLVAAASKPVVVPAPVTAVTPPAVAITPPEAPAPEAVKAAETKAATEAPAETGESPAGNH